MGKGGRAQPSQVQACWKKKAFYDRAGADVLSRLYNIEILQRAQLNALKCTSPNAFA